MSLISSRRETRLGLAMLLLGLAFLAPLTLVEIGLRHLAPVPYPKPGGALAAPNSLLYGWAYYPLDRVQVQDPDTGQVFVAQMNDQGWRDRTRNREKTPGTLRILLVGDSVSFGVLVSDEHMLARQIEKRLGELGIRADVMNISAPGWGTDQELEALSNSGLLYSPDLVLLQFSVNDLNDNLANPRTGLRGSKPFTYEVDSQGSLQRKKVPEFETWRPIKNAWDALTRLELVKRARKAWEWLDYRVLSAPPDDSYEVAPIRVGRIQAVLALSDQDPILQKLRTLCCGRVPVSRLMSELGPGTIRSFDRAEILRALKRHPFDFLLKVVHPDWELHDAAGPQWTLYRKLLSEFASRLRAKGIPLVVLSEQETGLYDWLRYWMLLKPGEETRARFLSVNSTLAPIVQAEGAGWVPHKRTYPRGKGDGHPRAAGYRAMAEDVVDFLTGPDSGEKIREVLRSAR